MPEVTMHFLNIGDQAACLEYSYIPSGKRRVLQLQPGDHAVARTDTLASPEVYSLVQVYSVQTQQLGASWDAFGQYSQDNSVHAVIFQIRDHHQVVGTSYYSDGTSYSETKTLTPTDIECPSGL